MNIQNYSTKDEKKKTLLKPRLRSSSKEGTQQLTQARIAVQGPTVYRNTTADKHLKHSVDNKKQLKQKKKKKTQKKIQQLDNEEEQRLLEEEQKRLRDLEEFQKKQWEKMTQEERDRLKGEENDRQQIEMIWDREILEVKKKKMEIDEWNNFITCNNQIDPRSEKDLNTLIYQFSGEYTDQQANYKIVDYISKIIFLIQVAQMEDQSQSLFNKQEHYSRYIEKFRQIQIQKIQEFVKYFYTNYESFLDEMNKILKSQHFLPEFTLESQQRILQKLASKPDDRSKYEILKYSEFRSAFRLAFWYCPISKIGYRIKPIDFSQINNLQVEIPRQLAGQGLIYYVNWTDFDPFIKYRQYNQYLPISGIYQTYCVNLPRLPKKTSGWVLKQTFTDSQLDPIKLQTGFSSYSCFFQIQKKFYLKEASKIFAVTYQNGQWTQEGIEELKVNTETRSVSFQLKTQLPFMLATFKFVDFPFKMWKVTSLGPEKLYLKIITRRDIEIGIELDDKYAKLIKPIEIAKEYLPNSMPIIELLLQLREMGINLIAQEEDAICLQTSFKRSELENQVLLNMMQTLRVYSFKQSKWSQQCGADSIIIQFIENPIFNQDFEGDDEFKWRHLEFQMNKVALLDCNEKNEKFSNKWFKNTLSHANLLILIQQHQITPAELQFYLEEIQNIEFRANFRTMMKVMRLLSIN